MRFIKLVARFTLAFLLVYLLVQYLRDERLEFSCNEYVPADVPLIAHAGGGLPDRIYANNLDAMNLAVEHGFKYIEIDFLEVFGWIAIGHSWRAKSGMSLEDLLEFLEQHDDVMIVTDFKTKNARGLAALKAQSGELLDRFIPQIYSIDEFQPVAEMEYPAPILTAYRIGDDGWQEAANTLPLRAITMPYNRRYLAEGVEHFVYLHTVNQPISGYGLYTDCLIPLVNASDGGAILN